MRSALVVSYVRFARIKSLDGSTSIYSNNERDGVPKESDSR